MCHHYRIPPGVTGTLDGTVPFTADDAIAAIRQKRNLCREAGLPALALKISAFTMQVYFGHNWLPTVGVSIRHGGLKARGGR